MLKTIYRSKTKLLNGKPLLGRDRMSYTNGAKYPDSPTMGVRRAGQEERALAFPPPFWKIWRDVGAFSRTSNLVQIPHP